MEKEFLELAASVFEVDAETLSLETKYKESGWDSLHMLVLIMEIEEQYAVSVPMEKINDFCTLADFYALIEKK